jgi:response regulator RpfG family c-di-GMP phosphodiesterase
MRVRIVRRPHGRVDGISLDRFEPGFAYDVGSHIGNLLLAEGWAEPTDDQRPAMVIPLPDDKPQSLILVIDDDRATRAMLTTMLTLQGYAVRSARGGAEGLKLLQEHPPQLVLLDLKMPHMNGAEFRAAQQRLAPDLARIPIVIISGVPGAESERERLRAVDFIAKPINDSALLEAVRAVCGTPSQS